jgi:hypothetical protein
LKGILTATYVFKGGDRLYLLQVGPFREVEGRHVSVEENHLW